MPKSAWKQLLAGAPWFKGEGRYPIAAYSEFMPPPRFGLKPYGCADGGVGPGEDPFGWPITEYEEALILRPGLQRIAEQLLGILVHLGRGEPAHGIARGKLENNPYWPPALAEHAGKLPHERYVLLLPLALSRTLDDKGRILWTLFGGSEQGPARAFWKSFYTAPGHEATAEQGLAFLRALLHAAYGKTIEELADLHHAGFRIFDDKDACPIPYWHEPHLPSWTAPLLLDKATAVHSIRYLLTFRPFGKLPAAIQQAYLGGELHLLPFPGSLVFWGTPPYLQMQGELPFAMQIPLQHMVARSLHPFGIRVPQSGWLHEPRPDQPEPAGHHGPVRNTYRRTHRWGRAHRDEDELAIGGREEKLMHVLFSTAPDDLGLYDKPMARNVQLWTHDCHLLLDGPRASRAEILNALHTVKTTGGMFGYRFQFPAMRVGRHEIYWQRPLVAYLAEGGEPTVMRYAPAGYLTAYEADRPDLARPLELWPRFLRREEHLAAVQLFEHSHDPRPRQTTLNIRKLLETQGFWEGKPLPRSLARELLTLAKCQTLENWLVSLPERGSDPDRGHRLMEELHEKLEPLAATAPSRRPPRTLTFDQTSRRGFEVDYWKTIAFLAHGKYRTKNNADCVRDPPTQAALAHHHRDLDALGDYLLDYYRRTVSAARMTGKALVGDLPFHWKTDFEFSLFGGWLQNQEGHKEERDLIVVIPGRDRRRAVIMADHYDTAFMADHYEKQEGGTGARLAAAGADDNHSATAALMLGAPLFLRLSRARKLACDIWLIHLTGEEFPADCLGARHLCQCLVEGTLRMRLSGGKQHDLSRTRVQGVYVLDMVAHNNDHERDVFQISPGTSRESMWLAYQAHLANEAWNRSAPLWNRRPSRRSRGRGQRSPDSARVPDIALHPGLRGEVRPPYAPRSTLYNTDGQIFSDAGVPVVLFMENYDINRSGYHDSHDTMANIDLDYGSAVAAIAIESVARAATEKVQF
jgi:hypothetical protein